MKKKVLGILIAVGILCVSSVNAENLLSNFSFEEGLDGWNVPHWMDNLLAPAIDKAIVQGPGSASVRMVGEEGKRGFLYQRVIRNPAVKRYKLSGWIKLENFENNWTSGIGVEFIGNNGEWLGITGAGPSWEVKESDWKKYEKEFEVPEGTTTLSVLVSTGSPSGEMDTVNLGTAWFDNIILEEIVNETNEISIRKFSPLGEKGIFLPDQPPEFVLQVINSYGQEKIVSVEITVKDFFGKSVYQKEEPLTLKPLAVTKHQFSLPAQKELGFYGVNISLKDANLPISKGVSSFCILSPPKDRDPFFGINWFIMGPSMAKAVHLMGAGTVGLHFNWSDIEREKGKYDFTNFDNALDKYLQEGFRVIGAIVLKHTQMHLPDWLFQETEERKKKGENPYPPEYFEAFGRFMEKVVSRYKDRVKVWSFIQEIDLGLEAGDSIDRYTGLIKAGYLAAKKADPDCIVGGVGVSGVDGQKQPRFPYAKKIWPLVYPYLDGMFFDPYVDPKTFGPGRKPIGPERGNLREILLEAKAIINQYGKNKLSIEEKGLNIITELPVDSPYAKEMAKHLSRNYIIAKSIPEVDRFLWHTSFTFPEGAHDYGLWKIEDDGTYNPRPLVAAYATTSRLLSQATDPEEINLLGDVYAYVFKKGEGCVTAIWTILKDPVSVLVDLPGEAEVYNLMGNKEKTLLKGKQEIILTDAPLFLVSNQSSKTFAQAIKQASCSLPLIKAEARLASLNKLLLYLANQTAQDLKVNIAVDPLKGTTFTTPQKEVSLPAKKVVPVEFLLKNTDFGLMNKNEFSAKITAEGRTSLVKRYLDLYPVTRAKGKVVVDGNLAEYKDIPPIVLDGLSNLFPVDAFPNRAWLSPEDLSTKVYLAYDDQYFYFAAVVTDDQFIAEVTGTNIWANDSFQLAFDMMNDGISPEVSGVSGYDTNDYEFGIALTPEGPQTFCWIASETNKELQGNLMDFPLAIKRVNETTTNYELAIPWENLSPLKPEKGRAFGFNFINLDTDTSKSTAFYWMGLTEGIAEGKDPSYYKTFILMP